MTIKNTFGFLLVLLTWFALGLQLYLMTGSLTNFFSYFTILSNLLVALSLSFALLAPNTAIGKFSTKLSTQSAIALYIFVVSFVYNLVLRGNISLAGWDVLANELLHVFVPLFYIVYWAIYRTKNQLAWKDGFPWLLFPFFYLVYSLIRGAIVGWYPYPFLNATKLGYAHVSFNIALMILVFLAGAMGVIAVSRMKKRTV